MRLSPVLITAGLTVMLTGCFFRSSPEERCVRPQEYQASNSIEKLRVPTGLDAPDEGSALEIPETGQQGYQDGRPCLEMPPDYFGRPVD